MGANVGAIDQDTVRPVGRGQRAKNQRPATRFAPVSKAIVYGFSVPEVRWQISPGDLRFGDPDDRVQEGSSPQVRGSTCAIRAQRADSSSLGVCEAMAVHPRPC